MANDTEVNVVIDWNLVDSQINNGTCKLKPLAAELEVPAAILRAKMEEHYGDRVEYRRGRKGGIYWANQGQNNKE